MISGNNCIHHLHCTYYTTDIISTRYYEHTEGIVPWYTIYSYAGVITASDSTTHVYYPFLLPGICCGPLWGGCNCHRWGGVMMKYALYDDIKHLCHTIHSNKVIKNTEKSFVYALNFILLYYSSYSNGSLNYVFLMLTKNMWLHLTYLYILVSKHSVDSN